MNDLKGRTVFVSGGSRGIGLAIACACAAAGADVALAAKTDKPHPKLPGTVHTAAEAVEAAGGRALPLVCDIRDEKAVRATIEQTVAHFGRLDVLINNASAIALTPTLDTPVRRYDLMSGINARGTFVTTQAALPHLLASDRGHVLSLAPPPDLSAQWFKGHPAYSLAKYSMSLLTLGWAAEFEGRLSVNALWPRTTIDTAAVRNLLGGESMAQASRTPAIMGEAALAILKRGPEFSGWFCLDDLVLAAEGITDFEPYAVSPGTPLQPDFFVPASAPAPEVAAGMVGWRAPSL